MNDYVVKLQADLRKRLDDLCWMHNEPALHVANYFAELRRQVDLDAEQLLNEIQLEKRKTGKARKYSDVNETRLEFIRILEELEKRTGLQPKPDVFSNEAYASLEQRVHAFEDLADSLDDLEDSYVQLTSEIAAETERVEKRLLGEQTIIYWPHHDESRLGSLVYFGDIYLSQQNIDRLGSEKITSAEIRRPRSLICPLLVHAREPHQLSKIRQVIRKFPTDAMTKFASESKFFYIGKTKDEYAGYCAEGSSLDIEFISYQYSETAYGPEVGGTRESSSWKLVGVDNSANIFDVYSKKSWRLFITNTRLDGLHVNLLPSPAERLVSLDLTDVHFDSFDTHLLATCTRLASLRLHITLSKSFDFDPQLLAPLRNLHTLELALPHSPMDLSAFKEFSSLRYLKLWGSSYFYAEKRPRLSKAVLEQILSAPRLERIELSCFDIEAIDREMLSECKNLTFLELARSSIGDTHFDPCLNIGFPKCVVTSDERDNQEYGPWNSIKLTHSGIRVLSATSFAGMKDLRWLSLSGNSIAELPLGCFEDLPTLGRLDLDRNLIRNVSRCVFGGGLVKLKTLNMNGNPIESIEKNAFERLNHLRELSLSDCQLKTIDSEMFKGLKCLGKLTINNNLVERIEVVAEDGSRINVAKADLSDEERKLVEKRLFEDLNYLDTLNMKGNKLQKLDLNCFSNLRSLYELDLSSNMINQLSSKVAIKSNLAKLVLMNNHLISIDKNALPPNLINLDLSKNRFKRLNKSFFARFKCLRSVNLAENELTWTITRATFGKFSRLSEINLTQNVSIKGVLEQIPHLEHIECDFSEHFAGLVLSRTLRIRKLSQVVIRNLWKIHHNYHIYVVCLSGCSIKYFKKNSDWKNEQAVLEPHDFNLCWLPNVSRLREIDFSRNLIETFDDPELFADFKRIFKINLSDNKLSRMHRDIFKCMDQLETIDLSGNQLSSIDTGLFRHLDYLKQLNLSSNKIEFLNMARLFRVCPQLESLNIANNQLDERSTAEPIDAKLVCYMHNFVIANNRLEKMDLVRDMTRLLHLDLRGNRIETVMSINGENLLGRLSKLTHLDLSQNRIHSLREEMFTHLYHQLSFVDLSGNLCDFKLSSV